MAGNGALAGANGGGAGAGYVRTDGVGEGCLVEGDKRTCCDVGSQVCSGSVEFKGWGPCLDASGKQITCSVPVGTPGTCETEEFPQPCVDASVPPGDGMCGAGEFGPNCVPSTPPGDDKPICGPGEFGPMCLGDGGVPPAPRECTDKAVNNEPEILVAFSPDMNATVSQNGQIKVWITDECPLLVAPDEKIDDKTGAIMQAGDRTAVAEDNFLLEPALYIAPASAASGGTPHFPQYIKGFYNNVKPPFVPYRCRLDPDLKPTEVPGMDPNPPGTRANEMYNSEVIWDVKALNLKPGTYLGQFMIHDGDHDRGVGCVTITIKD